MQKNTVIISIISFFAIFGFLYLVYTTTSKEEVKIIEEAKIIQSTDHVKWSANKKHVLTEYSDLQCPACRSYQPVLLSFESPNSPDREIAQNITFVYRHFPLTMHQNADVAAYAAEAAGKQGKFFEMTDVLFENQPNWAESSDPVKLFTGYAKRLKLDIELFTKDLKSEEVQKKVREDAASGQRAGIASTPTFFLDGVKIQVNSFEEFKKLLKDTVKK